MHQHPVKKKCKFSSNQQQRVERKLEKVHSRKTTGLKVKALLLLLLLRTRPLFPKKTPTPSHSHANTPQTDTPPLYLGGWGEVGEEGGDITHTS